MVRLVELLRMRLEALKLLHLWLLGRFVLHDRVHGLHHCVIRMVHLHRDGKRMRTGCLHLIGVLELLTGMHIWRVLRVVNRRKVAHWRQVHVRVVELWLRLGCNRLAWLIRGWLFLLNRRNAFLIFLFLVVGRSICPFSFLGFLRLCLHFLFLDLLPFLLRTVPEILVILLSHCFKHYLSAGLVITFNRLGWTA